PCAVVQRRPVARAASVDPDQEGRTKLRKRESKEARHDLAQSALEAQLLVLGRERGFVTYDEVTDVLAHEPNLERGIHRMLRMLASHGVSLADHATGKGDRRRAGAG